MCATLFPTIIRFMEKNSPSQPYEWAKSPCSKGNDTNSWDQFKHQITSTKSIIGPCKGQCCRFQNRNLIPSTWSQNRSAEEHITSGRYRTRWPTCAVQKMKTPRIQSQELRREIGINQLHSARTSILIIASMTIVNPQFMRQFHRTSTRHTQIQC